MRRDWVFSTDGRLRAGWRAAAGFVAMAMVAAVLAPILASVLASAPGGPRFELAYRTLTAILLAVAFWWLARSLDGVRVGTMRYIGLAVNREAAKDTVLGLVVGLLTITFAAAAIALFGNLEVRAAVNATTLRRAAFVAVLLVGGAMAEELMFRGYVFQRLVEATRPVVGVIFLSLLFGAVHLGNPSAKVFGLGTLNTALVGAVFAIAYLRTQSLWLPFGWHFAWNFTLGVVYGLPVSGINSFSVVTRSRAHGPGWLTGGSYGIEASVTGTVVILLGLAAVLKYAPRRPAFTSPASHSGATPERFGLADGGSSGIQST